MDIRDQFFGDLPADRWPEQSSIKEVFGEPWESFVKSREFSTGGDNERAKQCLHELRCDPSLGCAETCRSDTTFESDYWTDSDHLVHWFADSFYRATVFEVKIRRLNLCCFIFFWRCRIRSNLPVLLPLRSGGSRCLRSVVNNPPAGAVNFWLTRAINISLLTD